MVVVACLLAAAGGACGSEPAAPSATTPAGSRESEEAHDNAVEAELDAMQSAARRGDRPGVGRAQRELERLHAADPSAPKKSAADDPFERAFDEFPFKRAPLFVQQITQTQGSHRVFAGIDRTTFCLLTIEARIAAVEGAYGPIERRLRADRIDDLEFVVVPQRQTAPTIDDALAIGRDGSARLTRDGRGC
jgi:hypothetical protein